MKKGDIVRITGNSLVLHDLGIGTIGVVTHVDCDDTMRVGDIYDCGENWFKITKIDGVKYSIQWDGLIGKGLLYQNEFDAYLKTHQITKRAGFKEYLEQIEQL